jgi:glycosyltransferase involved in cell wall biosynthesis
MSLDSILSRIASGEAVPPSELLPYLSAESREQRANVNRLLADACWRSGSEEQLRHAKTFISRAWLLSRFSPELIPLYERIHSAAGDIDGIRDAYKRLGMTAAAQGDASEALRYFNLWQYGYQRFQRVDRYAYDVDILDCVDRLAAPDRFSPRLRPDLLNAGKIRVAYLAAGVTEVGSPIMMVIAALVRRHDRSRFEPMVFVPETERMVKTSAAGREQLERFRSFGCELVMAPDIRPAHARLVALGHIIHGARPDVLITSAALATFDHCFVASLRPAPVTIGLIQGPPQQFAPLTLDWAISWTLHPLLDCPVNCALHHNEFELPSRREVAAYDRGALDIPRDAVVILSAGRHVKFQDRTFWQAIVDLLEGHPSACYVAMGVEETQVPFLSSLLTSELRSRIRFLGWRGDDYLPLLCMADIVIDTFPSGGGAILFDAMSLGVPVVSFKNDYMKLYDQVDWSPAEEFIHVSDLLLERGDFAEMRRLVSRLIEDREYRSEMARRCQEDIQDRTDGARSLRKYEATCLRVLAHKLSHTAPMDGRTAEVEQLTHRIGRPRAPRWVATAAAHLRRALRFGERLLDRVASG